MSVAKIIGKIHLSKQQLVTLKNLGVSYIAADNPNSPTDEKEIMQRIGEAEAIIINISIHITKKIIRQCKKLRFIQTWSTGMDNIDLDAAMEAGILVKNVPDYSTESVAEKTIGMMIFIANKIREAHQDVLKGNWNYLSFQGVELKNKTLLLVGVGRIGSRVAELAKAFGMVVISADSKTNKDNLKDMYSKADFIVLHCPLNEKTYHLLSDEEFKLMKKGVYLINAARGGVVDESALLRALDNEIVAYASLDVLEQELPNSSNPLIDHPKVFVTPHIMWYTKESVERLTEYCIRNLAEYLYSKRLSAQ
ncbi:MAG TPA: NAD(P)-dependent oxidoreductase [Gammaproteobacteria bacterium]|nr:NAD(P)-dependent oxidoreductase [Gammaproteobacteria bacterium]